MNKRNKGFTLAEMLIVVAIIGILISMVTAVINTTMEKAREATDIANLRAACEEMNAMVILNEPVNSKFEKSSSGYIKTYVRMTSKETSWQTKSLTLDNLGRALIYNNAYCTAPDSSKPIMRVRINIATGAIDFNKEYPGNFKTFYN